MAQYRTYFLNSKASHQFFLQQGSFEISAYFVARILFSIQMVRMNRTTEFQANGCVKRLSEVCMTKQVHSEVRG